MATTKTTFLVYGFKGCSYFVKAAGIAKSLEKAKPTLYISKVVEFPTKEEFRSEMPSLKKKYCSTPEDIKKASIHATSPIIWKTTGENKYNFIGGCDQLEAISAKL